MSFNTILSSEVAEAAAAHTDLLEGRSQGALVLLP